MPISSGMKNARAKYMAVTSATIATMPAARRMRGSLGAPRASGVGDSATGAESAGGLLASFTTNSALLLDAHFVADVGNAVDLAGDGDCLVDLGLAVDETAQLDAALAGHHGDVEALDVRVGQQRRLHFGGDDAVVQRVACRPAAVLQADAVFDAGDPCHSGR